MMMSSAILLDLKVEYLCDKGGGGGDDDIGLPGLQALQPDQLAGQVLRQA